MELLDVKKQRCSSIQKKIDECYEKIANKLFDFDMNYLKEKYNERIVKDNNTWILDNEIFIRKRTGNYQEGCFEIEDRRNTPFLWGFEYELDNICIGDSFIFDNKPYCVSLLSSVTDSAMLDEIDKLIGRLEESYEKLKYILNNHYSELKFKYYDCHEEIYCESITEVIETVLKRKP